MNGKKSGFQKIEMRVDDIQLAGDPLSVPTVFADFIRGGMAANGVVRFNLVENRLMVTSPEVRSVTVARVAMPVNQLRAWSKFFGELADREGVQPEATDDETPSDG